MKATELAAVVIAVLGFAATVHMPVTAFRFRRNWGTDFGSQLRADQCFSKMLSDLDFFSRGPMKFIYSGEVFLLKSGRPKGDRCEEFRYLAKRIIERAERTPMVQASSDALQTNVNRALQTCVGCNDTSSNKSTTTSTTTPTPLPNVQPQPIPAPPTARPTTPTPPPTRTRTPSPSPVPTPTISTTTSTTMIVQPAIDTATSTSTTSSTSSSSTVSFNGTGSPVTNGTTVVSVIPSRPVPVETPRLPPMNNNGSVNGNTSVVMPASTMPAVNGNTSSSNNNTSSNNNNTTSNNTSNNNNNTNTSTTVSSEVADVAEETADAGEDTTETISTDTN